MWEENLATQAGVCFAEGVCLIWGPLNTSFNVVESLSSLFFINSLGANGK